MARYEIDSGRTTVWIEARSSLHPIRSETSALRGWFDGDIEADGRLSEGSSPKAELELPIDLMSSGNGLYDREMKRRVDARRYPTITATLAAMMPTATAGRYRAEGDVTFHGVTRRVSDELALSAPEPGTVVFEGQHAFNLPDFGMQPPRIMMLKVYPDVTIRVRIVAKDKG
jgi:polyisoprenoid-binding protein YceI